ncbi:hypothetical protein TYRP_017989, partial [Tyrophagus putrescentiae]
SARANWRMISRGGAYRSEACLQCKALLNAIETIFCSQNFCRRMSMTLKTDLINLEAAFLLLRTNRISSQIAKINEGDSESQTQKEER